MFRSTTGGLGRNFAGFGNLDLSMDQFTTRGRSHLQRCRPGVRPLHSKQQIFAVFLEDVILVTDTGYDVLSKGMPYTVQEIEDVMRQTSIIEAVDHRQH
jgi:hypothetical protein